MIKTYECPSCGEFEHECRITDKELKTCNTCNQLVKRVFKTSHYSFKCDGFCGSGHA